MITGFAHSTPQLPILNDKELSEYHAYQVSRIKCMLEVNFCVEMLPVATALRDLSEQEMKKRNLWLRK